jgi:hypothetical protein
MAAVTAPFPSYDDTMSFYTEEERQLPPFAGLDIETIRQPPENLIEIMPDDDAPSNYKDPVKIEAYKAAKREKWLEDAAKHADRGEIALVGIKHGLEYSILTRTPGENGEYALIAEAWRRIRWLLDHGVVIVGFDLLRFDLPFMVRRSWALEIPVPPQIYQDREGPYYSRLFVDLMREWQQGDRSAGISLERLAFHLGVPGKSGDGANFGAIYAEDPGEAAHYLEGDLDCTLACAKRMVPHRLVPHWAPSFHA